MAQETIILAANAQRSERIAGRFFTVLSATAKFSVELDGRQRREVRVGSKISDEPFRRISFFETEGAENTIVYDAGNEEYQGETFVSQKVESTYVRGSALAPNSSPGTTISGRDGARQRKSIIFLPLTGAGTMRVYDSIGGMIIDITSSSAAIILETDDDLTVKAQAGSPVGRAIQTFYR